MSKLITHPLPRREDYRTEAEYYKAQNAYYENEEAVVRSQEQKVSDLSLS